MSEEAGGAGDSPITAEASDEALACDANSCEA